MATDEWTPSERVGIVVWHLAHGEGLTTREIAELTGLTESGAWRLISRLCRRLPIYLDEQDHRWQVLDCKELQNSPDGMRGR